jgi:diguanylate cyclase (GGDEF)-like protein
MKNVARESDIAARYGGEEFALLLPNTSAAGALDVVNRLSTIIREYQFENLHGDRITISSGTSTVVGKNLDSYEQLVRLADEAMYKAKKLGKNCVSQA